MLYHNHRDIPTRIPLFPLAGALLLPRGTLPLKIFEPRYLQMTRDSLKGEKIIGMIQPKDKDPSSPLYETGCAGRITGFREMAPSRQIMSLTGICRFRLVKETDSDKPYREATVDYAPFQKDLVKDRGAEGVRRKALLDVLKRYLEKRDMRMDWRSIHRSSNETLVTTLAIISPYDAAEKQAMLEAESLAARCDILIALTEIALAPQQEPPFGKGASLQ